MQIMRKLLEKWRKVDRAIVAQVMHARQVHDDTSLFGGEVDMGHGGGGEGQ